MLSRTAASLYWTGRYVERADFVSRLTDATLRLAALPSSYGGDVAAWSGALSAAGGEDAYRDAHGEVTEQAALQFMSLDPANPSSMRSCIERARTNARAVRTALTAEVWEGINSAWLDMQRFGTRLDSRLTLNRLLDSVKSAALSFDGANQRTMLRDDAYWFIRLGATIERADNTARLLDVKYHLLLPRDEPVGGSLDYFQWTTILRTVSALTAYRHVYREAVKPWLVADLLILNRRMPRSLSACAHDVVRYLDHLAQASGRRGAAHRAAVAMAAELAGAHIDTLFAGGLHEQIIAYLAEINRLGALIGEQYLVLMRAQVAYRTTYRYALPAGGVVQALRLTPGNHDGQHVLHWRVDADVDGAMRETRDAFGNRVQMFYADGRVDAISIAVTGEADLSDTAGLIRTAEPLAPAIFRRTTPLTQPDAAVASLAARVTGDDPLADLHRLNAAIFERMVFEVGATDATTSAGQALQAGHGVCQDFAHIFLATARLMGRPARYVSGHLIRPEDGQQAAGHAWAEALVPDLGWVAFDPTNGISPTDAYLRVAVGLDYLDAAPIRGARRGGGAEELTVTVRAVESSMRQSQQQSQGQGQQRQTQG